MPDLLPAALDELATAYRQLVDAHTRGEITLEQAQQQAAGLSATDAGGQVWTIDPATGSFLCAGPGRAPVPAPASRFKTAAAPVSLLPPTRPVKVAPDGGTLDWQQRPAPGRQPHEPVGAPGGIGPQPVIPGQLGIDGSRYEPATPTRPRRPVVLVIVAVLVAAAVLAGVVWFTSSDDTGDVSGRFPTEQSIQDIPARPAGDVSVADAP